MNINNDLVRFSIWKAYSKKCFYTGEPMKFREMVLDHVIPISLIKDKQRLLKTLNDHGLSETFNIRGIENIVPCLRKPNRDKSDEPLSYSSSILKQVKSKINTIEKIYSKCASEENAEKYKSYFKQEVDTGKLEAEELYDYLKGINPEYKDFESYNDNILYATYSKATPKVYFTGILPRPNRNNTTCCISFKSHDLRGLMLTLADEDIDILTNPNHKINTLQNQSDSNSFNELDGKLFFQFKQVNFYIDKNELYDLYSILEDYKAKIETHKDLVKKFYGARSFELSKSGENYKLGKIKKFLWHLMLEFAEEHDFDKGNSEWHMFNTSDYFLNVTSGQNSIYYDQGFHAMFIAEQIENDRLYGFSNSDDEIWITWNKFSSIDILAESDEYKKRGLWNAEMSYNWLVNDYIPKVIWHYEVPLKKKILKYRSFNNFKNQFKINNFIG